MVGQQFRLPRAHKILKADAYASALRMRICAQTENFVLHFCAHRPSIKCTQPLPQLGLVVPKKLAKHAVRRNTIKRVSREYFRLHKNQLANGLWVVRLKTNVNAYPLCAKNKRLWADQIKELFAAGSIFAQQYAQRNTS